MVRGIAILVVLLVMGGCTNYETRGVYRFNEHEYDLAANDLKIAASKGAGAEATTDMAYLYQYGIAFVRDEAMAKQLYEKAIAQGSVRAETALAILDLRADTLPQDIPAGLELLRKADADGDPRATFDLAYIYESGKWVARDEAQYHQLLDKAWPLVGSDWVAYVDAMYSAIERQASNPPDSGTPRHLGGACVQFGLDGRVPKDVQIKKTSGYEDTDSYAAAIVKSSWVLPPPIGFIAPESFEIAINYGTTNIDDGRSGCES